jgi:adenosylcobinamide kinase / adenosylcobinamide-phosphate guanylyltransferase
MPSTLYLVTGGCRSGKSSYAQKLCESLCPTPIYVATSSTEYVDDDFERRVQRHQQDRGQHWTTIEEPLNLSNHVDKFKNKTVLIDCCTLWLTNSFLKHHVFEIDDHVSDSTTNDDSNNNKSAVSSKLRSDAAQAAFQFLKEEFDGLIEPWGATFVVVTNEIGSGTHADHPTSRLFVDFQGWFNQYVASKADQVVHIVSGCPTVVKDFPLSTPYKPVLTVPVTNEQRIDAVRLDRFLSTRSTAMDSNGYFMIRLEDAKIMATFHSCMVNDKGEVCDLHGVKIKCSDDGCSSSGSSSLPDPMMTWKCRTAKELTTAIFEQWTDIDKVGLSVSHAAYIGREAQRAEHCLYSGTHYQQD